MRYLWIFFVLLSISLYAEEECSVAKDAMTITPEKELGVTVSSTTFTGEPLFSKWQDEAKIPMALGGFEIATFSPRIEEGKISFDIKLKPTRLGTLFFLPPPVWSCELNGVLTPFQVAPFSITCERKYNVPQFSPPLLPETILFQALDQQNSVELRQQQKASQSYFESYFSRKSLLERSALFLLIMMGIGLIVSILIHEKVIVLPERSLKRRPVNLRREFLRIDMEIRDPAQKMHAFFLLFKRLVGMMMRRECQSMTKEELETLIQTTSYLSYDMRMQLKTALNTWEEDLFSGRPILPNHLEARKEDLRHLFSLGQKTIP